MSSLTQNVYIGKRYVPLQCGDWDIKKEYESLSVVQWKGASYTSVQDVPIGIDITATEYWVRTADYNSQVEIYRQECETNTASIIKQFNEFTGKQEIAFNELLSQSKKDIENYVNEQFKDVDVKKEEIEKIIKDAETKLNDTLKKVEQMQTSLLEELEKAMESIRKEIDEKVAEINKVKEIITKEMDCKNEMPVIKHNKNDYPICQAIYSLDGFGQGGFGDTLFGGSNSTCNLMQLKIEYLNTNELKIFVPDIYNIVNPVVEKVKENHYNIYTDGVKKNSILLILR